MSNPPYIPDELEICIGGYPGPFYRVSMCDESLIEWSEKDMDGNLEDWQHVAISDQKWQTFRATLDALSVWEWEPSYEPAPGLCDGTSWSVSIKYPDGKVVKSEGREKYPNAIDPSASDWPEDSHSPDWALFCSLVGWMIDDCEFS